MGMICVDPDGCEHGQEKKILLLSGQVRSELRTKLQWVYVVTRGGKDTKPV